MFSEYRRYLFGLFAFFFILTTPFLIIYSLGFEINLNQQKIANTLGITIETLPRGATIKNRGFEIGKTPIEMKAADGELVTVNVEYNGYQQESFTFWTSEGTNASARVTNLALLPKNWDSIANFESAKPVGILSQSLILFQQDGKYFVQSFNLGGLIGKPSEVVTNLNNIQKSSWEQLSEFSYWDKNQNLLIVKGGTSWKVLDMETFPFQASNIISSSENQILLLDSSAKLWALDLDNEILSFLESGIQGIYHTISPDNIWIWRNDKVYRLSKGYIENTYFNLEGKIYSQNSAIENLNLRGETTKSADFTVSSLFQGLLFKMGNMVYYIPDFDKNLWQVIVSDAEVVGTDSNTVIWLDSDNNLFSFNLLLKEEQSFGKLQLSGNPENYKIFYYFTWRRIFVYSEKEVYTVWFDKDILNRNIVEYKPAKWIDLNCLPKVVEKFQFCQTEDRLVAYKNTALW